MSFIANVGVVAGVEFATSRQLVDESAQVNHELRSIQESVFNQKDKLLDIFPGAEA